MNKATIKRLDTLEARRKEQEAATLAAMTDEQFFRVCLATGDNEVIAQARAWYAGELSEELLTALGE